MKLLPDYPADSYMEMETMMKQPDTKLGDTADADKWKTKVLNCYSQGLVVSFQDHQLM